MSVIPSVRLRVDLVSHQGEARPAQRMILRRDWSVRKSRKIVNSDWVSDNLAISSVASCKRIPER